MLLKELQSLALDVKVLTENKEELALKDLIEDDVDMPYVHEKEQREEIELDELSDDAVDNIFEDNESVDIDDEFSFTKGMFDEDDDEIDTTIPDGDLFEDDFDDELESEDNE